MKHYTAAAGNLELVKLRRDWADVDEIWIKIKPEKGWPVTRTLSKYETKEGRSGRAIDSQDWTDSVIVKRGKKKIVTPWTVWKLGNCDIEQVQVIVAKDEGPWTLALLPEKDLQDLRQKRHNDKLAKKQAHKEQKVKDKEEQRLIKKRRADEAHARMAAVNTAAGSARPPIMNPRTQQASLSSGSSTPSVRRTSLNAGHRRSISISDEKDKVIISESRRSSVSTSGK